MSELFDKQVNVRKNLKNTSGVHISSRKPMEKVCNENEIKKQKRCMHKNVTRFVRRGLIHKSLVATSFCHHSIAALMNKPCMCVYNCQQFISLLFPRLLPRACKMSTSAWAVFNWLCQVSMKSHWAVSCCMTSQ